MSDLHQKTAQLSAKSVVAEGEKWIRLITTAPTLDRDLEVIDTASLHIPIKPKGWMYARDLTEESPVDLPFLEDHDFSIKSQLGSVRSMFINAEGELETVVGVTSLQRGQEAYTLAKEGHFGNSISATFDYSDARVEDGVIYDAEVVEVSAVFKGANRNARVLEVSKGLIQKEQSMAEAKNSPELSEKYAELERITKEIETAEAAKPTEETPEEAPKTEVVEEQVVETPEQTEEAVVTTTEAEPVEEAVQEQPKSEEKETKKMSETTSIASKQVVTPAVEDVVIEKKSKQIDKYEFAAKQFVAWVNKDQATLTELNKKALESYKGVTGSKATYMNTGVVADGGAIVPEAQLLADVYSTLSEYSTVANDLKVVTLTEGNALDVATLVTDVIMTEVATEGGKKDVTKLELGDGEVSLREFAGIAIVTKKLVRQAAVNIFDLLRESFARAIANRRAAMALTDASSGIANKAGVAVVTTAAGSTTVNKVTWSEVKKMPYQIPTGAVAGSKYYISRELLEVLDDAKDANGRDLDLVQLDGDGLSGTFKNKYRFAVEESLGKGGAPHAVFGAMGRFGILLRQGSVESETFDTGSVVDGAAVEHNLLQQNKLAHRVAFYENVGYPIPGAFVKLVLAAV